LNPDPNVIQSLRPSVGCCLISDLAPDPLLNIQARLVRGKIFQMQPPIGSNKQIDFFPLVPSGSVNVEINRVAPKALVKMPQTFNESFPVALRTSDHPSPSQQRSHPSKQIEPLAMLTGGRNTQSLSDLRPTKPKAGMQSKAGFILKDYGLPRSKRSQFFLGRGEISLPLHPSTEDTNILLALADTLTGASTIAPAGPSALFQNTASCESPAWVHPTSPDSTRTLKGLFLDDFLIPDAPLRSAGQDGLAASCFLALPDPDHLPDESIDSNSAGLCPGHRQSIPDAAPPPVAVEPQSLFPSRLPGLRESWTITALDSLRDALTSTMDFS
jgi:hypothetical protein